MYVIFSLPEICAFNARQIISFPFRPFRTIPSVQGP